MNGRPPNASASRVSVHPGSAGPACVMVTVWPPTVSFPVRLIKLTLLPTRNAMSALPVPDAVDVIVIQVSELDAVHVQLAPVVSLTVPTPP